VKFTYQFWGVQLDEYGWPTTHGEWYGSGPSRGPTPSGVRSIPNLGDLPGKSVLDYVGALNVILFNKQNSLYLVDSIFPNPVSQRGGGIFFAAFINDLILQHFTRLNASTKMY